MISENPAVPMPWTNGFNYKVRRLFYLPLSKAGPELYQMWSTGSNENDLNGLLKMFNIFYS